RVYDCTLDPSRWDETLEAIRTLLQGRAAQLALVDVRQPRLLLSKDRGMDAHLHEHGSRHLPEMQRNLEGLLDSGRSMEEPLVISRTYSPEMRATPYYRELLSQGFVDIAQMVLVRSPTRLSALGVSRHESVGVFGDREIEILRLLIPHVRRAVIISNV